MSGAEFATQPVAGGEQARGFGDGSAHSLKLACSAADDDRLALETRVELLLDGYEEGIHVDVKAGARGVAATDSV